MGTNFYVVSKDKIKNQKDLADLKEEMLALIAKKPYLSNLSVYNIKETLDNLLVDEEDCHIGKNSYGWRFAFAANNFNGLKDFESKFNPDLFVIRDEYDRELSLQEFKERVESTLAAPERDQNGKEVGDPEYTERYYNFVLQSEYNEEGYRLIKGYFS